MKTTENGFKFSNNITLRKFDYNTPIVRSAMQVPRSITEFNTGNKTFDYIEQEVNNTLAALNNERLKQTNVIDKVKKELKVLSMQAVAKANSKSHQTSPQSKEDHIIKNKYETYIRAQENQLKKLEKELVFAKEDIRNKEELLKSVAMENQKLTEQVNALKKQVDQDNYIKTIHSNLLHIIDGKEEYMDVEVKNPASLEVEGLLRLVEGLVNNLIKQSKEIPRDVYSLELTDWSKEVQEPKVKDKLAGKYIPGCIMSTTPLSNMKNRIKKLSSTLKRIEQRNIITRFNTTKENEVLEDEIIRSKYDTNIE